MQQIVIGFALGYFAGKSVVDSVLNNASISSVKPTGMDNGTLALLGGAAIYLAKPLPDSFNAPIAGFLLGAGVASMQKTA